tara:strand:- start:1831 stop:2412 length:582 start_codon:yes stop_codon:yes gene_type:complete
MGKIAAYLYRPAGKLYDFTEMVKYTEIKAKEVDVEIDEFYADGWDDIPNGIEELLADLPNYEGIILYSLDGITENQLKSLGQRSLYCINIPWATGRKALSIMQQVAKAGDYYSSMRSLNIRMGIKASPKQAGSAPYGFIYKDGVLVEEPEEKAILDKILLWRKGGMKVAEIAEKTKLDAWKIYGILNYWRNKK